MMADDANMMMFAFPKEEENTHDDIFDPNPVDFSSLTAAIDAEVVATATAATATASYITNTASNQTHHNPLPDTTSPPPFYTIGSEEHDEEEMF